MSLSESISLDHAPLRRARVHPHTEAQAPRAWASFLPACPIQSQPSVLAQFGDFTTPRVTVLQLLATVVIL
jgi:hypothetical protein